MRVEFSFESGLGGVANESVYLFAVFHDDVGRNAKNVMVSGLSWVLIGINNGEFDFAFVLFFEFGKDRLHHLTWSAPVGVEIENFEHSVMILTYLNRGSN